jgi:hypothetical protein
MNRILDQHGGRFRLPVRVDQQAANLLSATGFDYRRFKLFHLSILWRASIATLADFGAVELGEHAESLRRMILAGDAGSASMYPVAGTLIVRPGDGAVIHDLIAFHASFIQNGKLAYSAIYCGCAWRVVLGEDARDTPDRLREDGRLTLGVASLAELTGLLEILEPHYRDAVGRAKRRPTSR